MTTLALTATQQVSWQLEDFTQFKKCGEITISPDEKCCAMNCLFCPGICLQFDVFVQHVRESHGELIRSTRGAGITNRGTQTELEIDTNEGNEGPRQEDSAKRALERNETSAKRNPPPIPKRTATSIFQVQAETELAVGSDIEMEMQPEEPQEEVGLVFIMESASPTEMEEESIADPFEMLKCDRDEQKRLRTKRNKLCSHREKECPRIATRSQRIQKFRNPIESKREPKKAIVNYLLEAYKNNEQLWNPQHPEYECTENVQMFNEMSQSLLRDMNCNLDGAEICAIIKKLRSKYGQELTRMEESKHKKARFKYFDNMEFLRSIITSNKETGQEDMKNAVQITKKETALEMNSEVTKGAQNRAILSHLLNAFKNHEPLWNPEHPMYLKCNKSEIFQKISTQLRNENEISLTDNDCCTEIQKLRTRYRRELRLLHEHKGLYVSKLWCFDQMDFLKKIFEEQLFERLNKKKGVITSKPKTQYLKEKAIVFKSTDDHLTFIEIYKSYSALWDVDHPDFRSATYRNEELNQMLEEVNLMLGINSTLEQLQKTIFDLRKRFSAEKRRILDGDSATISMIHSKLAEFLDMNLGPFRCDVCDAVIKTSDQYKIHKSGHDGMQPFICTLCGKGFQIPGNLSIHIRRHKGDFPYACEVCEKKFATSTEVAIHMRTHTGERPYICDLCGKSFKTWSFFDIHRRTHLKQSNFHCPICEKSFYEKNRYTDHMNGHLNIRKEVCDVCGKAYTTFANLKKHSELHLSVQKYKCDICNKRFAQFASLRWHNKKVHKSPQAETEQMEQ